MVKIEIIINEICYVDVLLGDLADLGSTPSVSTEFKMKNNCPHLRVQDYTECCFDCGKNVYESEEEYTRSIQQERSEKSRANGCQHINVQEYTECCMDCGVNVYTGK